MPLMLALDTATEEVAVGLGLVDDDVAVLGEIDLDVPRASLTHLMPAVVRLLESAGRSIADVEAVVVGRGPGSFTGVRIGVAAAKGLAQGLGVPLYGVGTLDAVAERFSGREGLVGVVGDAMRREVYPALFRCAAAGIERLTPDEVSTPAATAAAWRTIEEPVLLTGNGLHKYGAFLSEALDGIATLAPSALWTPTGGSLLRAAWRARTAGRLGNGDAGALLPVYTRLSDAEEAERRRAGGTASAFGNGVAGPCAAPESR